MGDTMQQFRTHTCADLRKSDIGKPVKLSGWIHNKRDHGGVLFIDLRDNYGITQVVVRPEAGILDETARLRKEFVVLFEGMVEARDEENLNTKIPTGEIDLAAVQFEILGESDQPPFSIFPDEQAIEEVRLKYRYLDLRRGKPHENILLRSRVISRLRRL